MKTAAVIIHGMGTGFAMGAAVAGQYGLAAIACALLAYVALKGSQS